jgi:hypothetical protein
MSSKSPKPSQNLLQEEVSDFDESLLEANLKKTVEERLSSHDAALEVAKEFERAGKEIYGDHDRS